MNVITSPYQEQYGKRYGLCNHYKCLYVTDTSALRESITNCYKEYTGRKEVPEQNLVVWNYAQLGRRIDQYGVETICDRFDYIFLDEIHQLFIYEDKFDTEDEPYYGVCVNALQDIVSSNTILICLSATPKPLFEYLQQSKEKQKVRDLVPLGDLPKIKCYTNEYDIPVHDVSNAIDEIRLEPGDKVFIFAHRIHELQNIADLCYKRGWTVTTLWSITHNTRYNQILRLLKDDTLTEEEREDLEMQLEKWHPMTPQQLEARTKLLKDGEFDTDVIILNAAYESGINIENAYNSEQRTIHVVVASKDEITITQARGRIRHDITVLWHLTNDFYDCATGVDAHKNLVTRLEQLAEKCRQDEYAFTGKQGKQEISSILQLYTTYKLKTGKVQRNKVKNIEPINNILILYELPFHIEQTTIRKKVNGKTKAITYYTVVDEREQ
jgi:hypothetical protein